MTVFRLENGQQRHRKRYKRQLYLVHGRSMDRSRGVVVEGLDTVLDARGPPLARAIEGCGRDAPCGTGQSDERKDGGGKGTRTRGEHPTHARSRLQLATDDAATPAFTRVRGGTAGIRRAVLHGITGGVHRGDSDISAKHRSTRPACAGTPWHYEGRGASGHGEEGGKETGQYVSGGWMDTRQSYWGCIALSRWIRPV